MPEQWTATVIGKMHLMKVKQVELAEQMGVTAEYLNAILNGKRCPAGAEQRVNAALDAIIAQQEDSTTSQVP